MEHRCPNCHKILKPPAGKSPQKLKYFPFCSQRCKLVDLGAWLDAEYRIISNTKSTQHNHVSGSLSSRRPNKR